MAKIVCLGEIMMRLSPKDNLRFCQANSFDVVYGGGEANVCVSLSNYGHDAYFVSAVPKNDIGTCAINELRKNGVNCEYVNRSGDRLGIYFLETGSSIRPSKVIYDRRGSSISVASKEDFDFDKIFKDAKWFHFSGITCAISKNASDIVLEACKKAKEYNVTISCDLNYRKKLWTSEEAIKVMKPLMEYVDVCIGNEEDAQMCLGYKPEANVEKGNTESRGYINIFERMYKDFNFKYIVSTLRESFSASHNGWKALIYDGNEFYESKRYDINPIVDRVGSGDSFSGGIIHGLLGKDNMKEALEFAVSASALKHTIFGDFNLVSEDEVESVTKGNISGRVQR